MQQQRPEQGSDAVQPPSIRKSLEEGLHELGFEGKIEVSQEDNKGNSLSGRKRGYLHSLAGLEKRTIRKKNNELEIDGGGGRKDEAAEKGRGQFITYPDKKAGCFPVADSKPARANTENILEKPSFFKD